MAVSTTGITPITNFAPVIWASEFSDAVQASTVLADLVDRSYENDLKFGKTIDIPDISNPAVRMKSEDTTATWANITETQQTITVNRHAYVAFLVEDFAEVQSKIAVRSTYTDKSAYSLAAFIEGDATSGLASLPSSFSQLVGTLGADLAEDDLIDAKNYLDEADVPQEDRFMYLSPGIHNSLLKTMALRSADYVGPSTAEERTRTGKMIGKTIHGAKIAVSTLAQNNPSTAGQSYGWFCHKKGVALIVQRKPMVHNQYVILETAEGVLVDVIYNFAERLIPPKTLGGATSVDTHNVGLRGI